MVPAILSADEPVGVPASMISTAATPGSKSIHFGHNFRSQPLDWSDFALEDHDGELIRLAGHLTRTTHRFGADFTGYLKSTLECPENFLRARCRDLKRILDPGLFRYVGLHGWGEPLLNRQIFEMIKYARSKGVITNLTTNGTLIRDRTDEILGSGLEEIACTIQPPPAGQNPRARVEGREGPDAYAEWEYRLGKGLLETYAEYFGDLTGRRMLDAGCGFGGKTVAYAERGAIIEGVDINPVHVEGAKAFAAARGRFSVMRPAQQGSSANRRRPERIRDAFRSSCLELLRSDKI